MARPGRVTAAITKVDAEIARLQAEIARLQEVRAYLVQAVADAAPNRTRKPKAAPEAPKRGKAADAGQGQVF